MSRVGKAPINMPANVVIEVSKGNLVTIKGPRGSLSQQLDPDITVRQEGSVLLVERPTDQKRHKAMHGLYRALVSNMVQGVSVGFVKTLEVVGVGYRASNTGNMLELTLGYSHPILFDIPQEVKVETKTDKGQAPNVRLECTDKELLGQVAAKIRALRKPEPYKGKGIRFAGEILRRKQGKTSGKK
jgi:large subunit ribosomal protein L6